MQEKVVEYKPYASWKSFNLIKKENKTFFKLYDYLLEVDENNYIPKAGLLFMEVINSNANYKNVLDLGCGSFGLLGLIALNNGAKNVLSLDVDNNCIKNLNKIIKENNIKGIEAIESNLYENINPNQKFDLILSNPPHMPMKKGKLCDFGGYDGKEIIKKILKESYPFLSNNGELYIMMFDFLGVDNSYNSDYSLFEYAKNIGYSEMDIVFSIDKYIEKGSVTYACLDYIKKIYPNYKFDLNNPKCKIIIVDFKK